MISRLLLAAALAVLSSTTIATAQDVSAPDPLPAVKQATVESNVRTPDAAPSTSEPVSLAAQPLWQTEGRACEGCPPRSVGRALAQTTIVNGFYELANLVRGQVTAHITPKTWWANMQQGWVWDLDDFAVNQVGHPYQGNNYFNTGRANGLSFWESSAVTAFGSATWEYYGETNHASLNDLINTTLGGIALGEMFHRAAWLIRDPQATGRGRLWREIGATAVDPITGANRFLRGDASRVTAKPPDMVPSSLTATAAAGALWRGTESSAFNASGQAFLEIDSLYGDIATRSSRTPYDAFAVRLRFGGGSAFSEARVRGRLVGQPLRNGKLQFDVLQTYDYQNNDAYQTGSQSFDAALAFGTSGGSRTRLQVLGWGGLTVLGAIDSLPLGLTEKPEDEEGNAGQGVSEGPRYYDYGPGGNFGLTAALTHGANRLAAFSYDGRHLYSLDGVRANHFLQRVRLDLLLPLRGPFGIGASAEYFNRRTYYQDVNRTVLGYHYPQLRGYFIWESESAGGSPTPSTVSSASDISSRSGATSDLWFTAGGTFSTLRGDCQTCETDTPYRHSGGLVGDLGYRVNNRMDVGGEVFWMPVDTADGNVRATHFDAVAQFRPWSSQGFFLKGGAGMALIRNWVDAFGANAFNSKALSLVIGAGWAFRPENRVGLQLFGTQHASAIGDFETVAETVQDVVGNYWSLGASFVIR